ncbi:MAG: patatin-like phospholipase family protein [Bacteroidales bacterium]|nr:patatin-like phospholipase family protein [Bacteroidales bacterium]
MRRILLTFTILLAAGCCIAQPSRPRVAVVLSGGGAKGVAHISALRVIEEAGIPIDIVCGTSMGSLIGGLYAIGYSTDELDSLVRSQDWTFLLTDRDDPTLQNLDGRRRQNIYAMNYDLGADGPTASGGLIRGKNLALLFDKLCEGYTDSMDFANLPLVYACVATDIVTNTEVDFFSGRLPQAMRASMAIPGVFTPVRMGDSVLIDGGLRNNYPADIARRLGADIIIGVTVQGDPATADQLDNAMSIMGQIIDVNCKNKYDANVQSSDLVMRVDVSGYSAASFFSAAIDTLLRRGDAEARSHWNELLALRRRAGIDSTTRDHTAAGLAPRPHHEETPLHKAHLRLHHPRVGIGLRFDTEEAVAMQIGLLLPIQAKVPTLVESSLRLGQRFEWRAAARLFPDSFTQPSLSYTFNNNSIDIYRLGYRTYNTHYNRHQVALTPIALTLRNLHLRASALWEYYLYYGHILSVNGTTFNDRSGHLFSYQAQLLQNSEDNWYLPHRGSRLEATYSFITDNLVTYNHGPALHDLRAHWRIALPLSRHLTLQPTIYTRMIIGSTVPLPLVNVLGTEWFGHFVEQQMPFAGVGHVELTDSRLAAAQLQLTYRFGKSHNVLLRAAAAQQGDSFDGMLQSPTLFGASIGYYYSSLIGPLGGTFGYSTITKAPYFYINLGHEF